MPDTHAEPTATPRTLTQSGTLDLYALVNVQYRNVCSE
jgi:hypothetical protein